MSADIEKLAVFDSRIVQSRPRYAVQKGALSLTNAPFNAISATSSQHTYNIYVPSENVFVDRAIEWTSTCFLTQTVAFTAAAADAATGYVGAVTYVGTPLWVPSVDWALPAFPLNSLCSTTTATINDTTSVINSQDVLKEVLRLCDYKKNRLQRTCPTMLDKYQCYDDGFGAVNSPLSGYASLTDYAEPQNGQFPQVCFTTVTGGVPTEGAYYLAGAPYNGTGAQPTTGVAGVYQIINGLPCLAIGSSSGVCLGPYTFCIKFTSTEKIVLSPFTFSDVHEWDTGLFGINNIQLIMNLQSAARLTRFSGMRFATPPQAGTAAAGTTQALVSGISSVTTAYNSQAGSGSFERSVVNVQFLTPSLDVPLPPKSVVPYMEFPRYITNYSAGAVAAGASVQIQSQTITLPQIPDLLVIYVKNGLTAGNYADSYMPISSRWNGVANPLSVNFDNFSGLLSSQTTEQLYAMSIKNGLDMDWATWSGQAYVGQAAVPTSASALYTNPVFGGNNAGASAVTQGGSVPSWGAVAGNGKGVVPLVGSILVLKPSQDITLQTGQAPSLVGNFTLQFNINVYNNAGVDVTPQLYVITANSGYFESIRGSSRIIKGVLSEQDIIGAALAPTATTQELHRYVGGAGFMESLGNILGKVKEPALDLLGKLGAAAGQEAQEQLLPMIRQKFGFGGARSGGMSGGEASGGAAKFGRTRKGLDARLM